jgi:hypothetical protein
VRYEVTGEPAGSAVCHCRDCQYVSGGEPAALVIVPRDALKITKGTLNDYTKKGDSGMNVTRKFCGTCGTQVLSDVESAPQIWVIKTGTLDEPAGFQAGVVLYTSSAQPWAHMPDGVPQMPKGM